jgi:predicted nucleic acid-binding protein
MQMRFVDTNVFIYAITAHPRFGEIARSILERIERGEEAATSILVLCEVAWVLEAIGEQGAIKPVLEKMLSYKSLRVLGFGEEELVTGASNMSERRMEFNDGVNLAIMQREGIFEAYSNDSKHLGGVEGLKLFFE